MAIPMTARKPVDFNPPSKPLARIKVRVPTPFERDNFHAGLVRGGVIYYSKKQLRELMIAGIYAVYPATFDDKRNLLETMWKVDDNRVDTLDRQFARLQELHERNENVPKAKKKAEEDLIKEVEAEITQTEFMDSGEEHKATALQQDIRAQYPPIQKAFADLAEQDSKRAWLCAEIYVAGWQYPDPDRLARMNVETPPEPWLEPKGNDLGGIVRHEAEYLRSQLGSAAWEELAQFIMALHGLDEDEEKNLQSLLAMFSAASGLTPSETTENPGSDAGPLKDGAVDEAAGTPGTSTKTRAGASRKTRSASSKRSSTLKTKTA